MPYRPPGYLARQGYVKPLWLVKLRRLRADVERVGETVHRHAADIAVIDDRCRERCAKSELSSRARAIVGSAVVMAVASVVVALISLIGG